MIRWGNATRGEVGGTYRRFISGHTKKSVFAFVLEDRGYNSACWIWQRKIQKFGYAECGKGKSPYSGSRRAHKVYFELIFGPVPEGKELDHLCRVRCCVNPNHLEPVTKKENARRGANAKLSHEDISEIVRLRSQRVMLKDIATQFGVTIQHLEMICRLHKVWVRK